MLVYMYKDMMSYNLTSIAKNVKKSMLKLNKKLSLSVIGKIFIFLAFTNNCYFS
jgi:hypothetical protein